MPFLDISSLTKRFGGLTAVDGVDISVSSGELVGLIGPNGAGKTTVFNLLSGLYAPDQGSILLNGQELAGRPPHFIAAAGLARTFQNIRLFGSLSALQNVLIGAHLHSKETLLESLWASTKLKQDEQALKQHSLAMLELLGIERFANEYACNLAYGVQRRLEIARSLASDPKLLLLDEPAAGMHPQETQALMELVQKIREQKNLTIILIEHDMRFVMGVCERIYVLDYGKVIAEGIPEEIRANPKVIEAYLGEAPL